MRELSEIKKMSKNELVAELETKLQLYEYQNRQIDKKNDEIAQLKKNNINANKNNKILNIIVELFDENKNMKQDIKNYNNVMSVIFSFIKEKGLFDEINTVLKSNNIHTEGV